MIRERLKKHVALFSVSIVAMVTPVIAADLDAGSRITAVTVYTTAAEVRRVAELKIPTGQHAVVLGDLPAQLHADSIRVEGEATGELEIGSVDTKSILLPEDASATAERKRLEKEIERLSDRVTAISDTITAAEARKSLIRNLAQLPVQPGPQGQPQGARSPSDWADLSTLIGTQMVEAQKEIRNANIAMRGVQTQIGDLQRKLAGIPPRRVRRTEVRVNVSAAAELDATLTIRYQVANAGWTPAYEARLSTGDNETKPDLQLTRRARVYQRTGEDWENIALLLSTTRPGRGTSAPRVGTLRAEFQPKYSKRQMSVSDSMAPEPMPSAPAMELELDEAAPKQRGLAARSVRKRKASRRQAKVVEAAFQASYEIPGSHTIPTDGAVRNIEIDRVGFAPKIFIRSVPRKKAAAFLYADMTVQDGQRLLPGATSLFRDGIFVGRGRLPTLTSGEAHELGFGEDDTVRVEHVTLSEKTGESGIISTTKTDTRQYRMTIVNGHKRAVDVRVFDQLPESGDDDIQVTMVGNVTPPTVTGVKDQPGVLAWDRKLAPQGKAVVNFGYRVSWPAGRTLRYREVYKRKRKSR